MLLVVKILPDADRKFEGAIATAVEEGRAAAAKLQVEFDKVHTQLKEAVRKVEPYRQQRRNGDDATCGTARAFIEQLEKRSSEMRRIFASQRAALGTVNLVLFGRTGTGKSSLIEAMIHGDGGTVSPGQSDWTTSVREVTWKGCRLLDTPGTNGWGGREDRSVLEGHARAAVEVADVVLLCFDSQSQQQPEFEKVAEWIRAFGKPVIAVLNCRNPRWRLPPRTPLASARRTVAEQMRQHEGNIRDELLKLGLENVPVVAISSKRGLMARGKEPFRGPDAVTFEKQRQEFGTERLLQWSNIGLLEQLLANALLLDAPGIRLGMLVANTKGLLLELEGELSVLSSEALQVAATLDSTIVGLLRILGYPSELEARAAFEDKGLGVDLLEELERVRGGRFETEAEGEFQIFCTQLLSARFAALRSRSLAAAEELVATSFNDRKEVTSEQFNRNVYNTTEIDAAGREVLEEAGNFLQRKVKLAIRDGQTDLSCLIKTALDIDGNAGAGWRRAGLAARIAGLLSGTALALAAANVWNPVGWAFLAAGIASAILAWFGRRSEANAEEKRAKARREALTAASSHVHDTFEAIIGRIAKAAAATGLEAMAAVLALPIREAVATYVIVYAAKLVTRCSANLVKALPSKEPQWIIGEAARKMERANGTAASARWFWLGEDWIDDPTGLVAPEGTDEPVARKRGPRTTKQITKAISDAFSMRTGKPRRGDGLKWLERAGRLLTDIPGAANTLAQVQQVLKAGRPRVLLLGDYNTGKSSFIKRLLIEAGQPIPKKLEIRANPTTKEVQEFEWNGLTLIDSPGLQSGRATDKEVAFAAFHNASHVICLFQPNVLGGTVDYLGPILQGDSRFGYAPKLGRSLLILNRLDELGVDPSDDPDEFDRIARRKQIELTKAFARRGVKIPDCRILCMASDPFGLVGERRDVNAAQYDAYRSWDGFDTFINAVKDLSSEAIRVGADIAALESGMAGVGALRIALRTSLAEAGAQLAFTKRLFQLLETAASEASRIRGHIEARLDSLLDQTTHAHIQDAMGVATDHEIQETAKALSQWWKDKAFTSGLERWEKESRAAIGKWLTRTQKEVGRRINSKEFLRAHPNARSAFETSAVRGKKQGRKAWTKIAESTVEMGKRPKVIYDIGKFFGAKFAPWGATKIATKIGRLGPYLAVLTVALDVWDWHKAAQSTKKRESVRKQATDFLHESSAEVKNSLLGGDDRSLGPRAHLDNVEAEVTKLRNALGIEVSTAEAALAAGGAQISALTDAIANARKKLGLPLEEVTYV